VIDTVGFAPSWKSDLLFLPTHPDSHLVEKLTLAQDRRHIDYEFTLDARAYLVEPATFRAIWDYRPDLEPSGATCDPEAARRSLRRMGARVAAPDARPLNRRRSVVAQHRNLGVDRHISAGSTSGRTRVVRGKAVPL
jgi:hypothetical protein